MDNHVDSLWISDGIRPARQLRARFPDIPGDELIDDSRSIADSGELSEPFPPGLMHADRPVRGVRGRVLLGHVGESTRGCPHGKRRGSLWMGCG